MTQQERATGIREAVQNFLNNRVADSPFLLNRYSVDLETQIMTTPDGEFEDGQYFDEDTGESWSNRRWPHAADRDPSFFNTPLTFDPSRRIDLIGTTWWNWVAKKSVAIGIDIDAKEGHADTTTTVDKEQLAKIIDRLTVLDYITIVKSTSGKGLHVYVFFDPDHQPDAANHNEHAIIAKKTLKVISEDIDYDLSKHVDTVGSVFWVYAKSSPADHPGFTLIKEGSAHFDASRLAAVELPSPTFKGNRTVDYESVDLDSDHQRILDAIQAEPYYFNHRADMNVVHTHTCAIKSAIQHGLVVLGNYETNSNGADPMTANCFLAPQRGGVFRVIRFGQSQHEPSWEFKNNSNFCYLNDSLSVEEIVSQNAEKFSAGRYILSSDGAAQIATMLGEPLAHPAPEDVWAVRTEDTVELVSKKGGAGFVSDGKVHKKILQAPGKKFGSFQDRVLRHSDERVRYIIQDGNVVGWFNKLESGRWLPHKNYSEIDCVVKGMWNEFERYAKEQMITNPWDLTCIPFDSEYPGDRMWNRNAPQLKIEPAASGGDHPHYDMILNHIGSDLDDAVMESEWCRRGNILCGADYLRHWIACLIHHTDQPLPYLFLAGPQNSGKSIFAEMLSYLFTHGVESAGRALVSEFNGELEGCFLAVIEERDLSGKSVGAYAKIKEWITGRTLAIRKLYQQQYTTQNYLHFVQMANSSGHLPIDDGDSRAVCIDVPALDRPMPKSVMEDALADEAPRFIRTLLDITVPRPIDRLRIPVMNTKTKELMERRAMTTTMAYCKEKLHTCSGHKVKFLDLYEDYKSHCTSRGVAPNAEFSVYHEILQRSDRFRLEDIKGTPFLLNVSLKSDARPRRKAL